MQLSFKDKQFIIEALDYWKYNAPLSSVKRRKSYSSIPLKIIIEALDYRIEAYQEILKNQEDLDEDEASDIGNDCAFLKALRKDLAKAWKLGKRRIVAASHSRTRKAGKMRRTKEKDSNHYFLQSVGRDFS